MASALLASCKTWLPWQDSSFSASNHTQINPSGYILGGVLYWTFSGCKSTNKTTTKTPESAFHRNGRRLLEEKQLKHIETMEKRPMDEQSEKNVGKVWLSSIKLACHALLWINGHGHRDSVPSLHTTSLSVNSNSSYHRDLKLTNVLEGDALHLLYSFRGKQTIADAGCQIDQRLWMFGSCLLGGWLMPSFSFSWLVKCLEDWKCLYHSFLCTEWTLQQDHANSAGLSKFIWSATLRVLSLKIDESSQSPACAQQLESGVRKS